MRQHNLPLIYFVFQWTRSVEECSQYSHSLSYNFSVDEATKKWCWHTEFYPLSIFKNKRRYNDTEFWATLPSICQIQVLSVTRSALLNYIKFCRSTDFEAPQLSNVRSGTEFMLFRNVNGHLLKLKICEMSSRAVNSAPGNSQGDRIFDLVDNSKCVRAP